MAAASRRALYDMYMKCKFSCGILGTASELEFGNRVIEREPLDESFPCLDILAGSDGYPNKQQT